MSVRYSSCFEAVGERIGLCELVFPRRGHVPRAGQLDEPIEDLDALVSQNVGYSLRPFDPNVAGADDWLRGR